MCRIAAYLGETLSLGDFVCAPPHGLAHQSWAAQEMTSATTNADGWGAAWFDAAGDSASYRQILPIWADVNLDGLGRSLRASTWVANVRSATAGLGTDYANTQPFHADGLLFVHNGFIDRFAHTLRSRMRAEIAPVIEVGINGNTDSEYLFALMRQQSGSLSERLAAALHWVKQQLADQPDVRGLLNVIVTDGRRIVAVRDSVHADAPSLYCHADWHGGIAVASEAMDNQSGWTRVTPGEMIIAEAGQPPVRERL